jgi:predicted dehydrogenase
VRVGVVGGGNMGNNHLRVYNSLKRVVCVGIFDPRADQAERLSRQYQCKSFRSLEEMIGEVDAVTVASPSNTHAEIAEFFLGKGVHCLVEKPLGTTEAECLGLIKSAAKNGVVLGVGHIERFNPVVRQLKEVLGDGHKVSAISVRRMSHAGGRIQDVDVILDLMVHDIDIVNYVFGGVGKVASALGVSPTGQAVCDHAVALLSFPGGGIATLEASRVTENKIRELTLNSDRGFVKLNFLSQELTVFRSGALKALPGADNPAYTVDLISENIVVRRAEPLTLELENFVGAVLDGTPVGVTGDEALDALRSVWEIRQKMIVG